MEVFVVWCWLYPTLGFLIIRLVAASSKNTFKYWPTILDRHKTILDTVDLPTPPWERETTGFWIDLPTSVLDALRLSNIDSAEAIHAAEHAFLNQFPLSEDLKTDCRVVQEDNKDSRIKRYPRYDSILYKAVIYWELIGH